MTGTSPRPKRGAFICFIGIDGSGKTTHALSLSKALVARGVRCAYIRPRYELLRFFPLGLGHWVQSHIHVRAVSVDSVQRPNTAGKRSVFPKIPLSFFYLFYAVAAYWLTIRLYSRNHNVVCDRYFYDWFHSDHPTWSTAMMRLLPKPNVGFLLDIPVDLAFSRMSSSDDIRTSASYYKSLRKWYIVVAKFEGFAIIDSRNTLEKTKDAIFKRVTSYLGVDTVCD